ncbi:MAG TPA: four helix bundle protein [Candidatus Limnocylindria bacterium]|nr:four helix bundle protein [Candidatus Limnocylindria bacterium]
MKNEKGRMKNGRQPLLITDRSFDFAVRIVKLCRFLDERRGVPRVLGPQILRSGTSVVSNIEEAQGAQSKADFISKMSIALKEARETHVRLRILAAADVIAESKLMPLIDEAHELKLIIGAIIVSAKGNQR